MKTVSKSAFIVILAFLFFLASACSDNENTGTTDNSDNNDNMNEGNQNLEEDLEPEDVTIIVGTRYLNEEEVKNYIIDPVEDKYPWITVEAMMNYGFGELEDLLITGEMPDLLITNNVNGMPPFEEVGLFTSIDELIEKHEMDLSRFEPETLEAVKLSAERDYLVGLPYTRQFMSLYFNKEVFDLLGVSYPYDGITWEEVTELARELTREVEGVQYRGLEPNVPERLAAQRSLSFIDPESKRSVVNDDGWRKVFNQLHDIYTIHGNEEITFKGNGVKKFTGDQNLAMFVEVNETHTDGFIDNNDMWDIVTVPVWEDQPEIGGGIDEHIILLSETSEHKDDAFRVMSVIISDEIQMEMSKKGKLTVLTDAEIQGSFGQDLSVWEGKNIESIFKTTPASPYQPSLYDRESMDILYESLDQIVFEGVDVNTALTEAEEKINAIILEAESAE